MADHANSQAMIAKQIDILEAKIAKGEGLTASEIAAYTKLLNLKGWDRELAAPASQPLTNDLPIDGEDESETGDRIIKFR